MISFSKFKILPIFQIPFILTNASLILIIGLFFLITYLFIQNKFIPDFRDKFLLLFYYLKLKIFLLYFYNFFFRIILIIFFNIFLNIFYNNSITYCVPVGYNEIQPGILNQIIYKHYYIINNNKNCLYYLSNNDLYKNLMLGKEIEPDLAKGAAIFDKYKFIIRNINNIKYNLSVEEFIQMRPVIENLYFNVYIKSQNSVHPLYGEIQVNGTINYKPIQESMHRPILNYEPSNTVFKFFRYYDNKLN